MISERWNSWAKLRLGFTALAMAVLFAGCNPSADQKGTLELFAEMRALSQKITKKHAAFDVDLAKTVQAAFDAGCRDPMIRYLYLRFHGTPGPKIWNRNGTAASKPCSRSDESAWNPIVEG